MSHLEPLTVGTPSIISRKTSKTNIPPPRESFIVFDSIDELIDILNAVGGGAGS
jgi:hypothetical protein